MSTPHTNKLSKSMTFDDWKPVGYFALGFGTLLFVNPYVSDDGYEAAVREWIVWVAFAVSLVFVAFRFVRAGGRGFSFAASAADGALTSLALAGALQGAKLEPGTAWRLGLFVLLLALVTALQCAAIQKAQSGVESGAGR